MNILLCIVVSILAAAVTARISAKLYLKEIDAYAYAWMREIESAVYKAIINQNKKER